MILDVILRPRCFKAVLHSAIQCQVYQYPSLDSRAYIKPNRTVWRMLLPLLNLTGMSLFAVCPILCLLYPLFAFTFAGMKSSVGHHLLDFCSG